MAEEQNPRIKVNRLRIQIESGEIFISRLLPHWPSLASNYCAQKKGLKIIILFRFLFPSWHTGLSNPSRVPRSHTSTYPRRPREQPGGVCCPQPHLSPPSWEGRRTGAIRPGSAECGDHSPGNPALSSELLAHREPI